MARQYREANYKYVNFYTDDESGITGVEWLSSEKGAKYVLLPIQGYTRLLEATRGTSAPDTVTIPVDEYNGLQKALKIVRDRAVQQIDRAKADEHGYTLLRADYRAYSYRYEYQAWLVTRSSPYSIRMSLSEASAMLKRDLNDYYGYRELPMIEHIDYPGHTILRQWDIKDFFDTLTFHQQYMSNRSNIGNTELLAKLDFLAACDCKLAFEVSKISKNHATGCYEVSYWATQPL